jgi:hypothetical protein
MPASVLTNEKEQLMAVMIGVDPHKGSHTAVALDDSEQPLGELRVRAAANQVEPCSGGRHRSRSGRGRSTAPAGSAVCWPRSWWLPASGSSTCQ